MLAMSSTNDCARSTTAPKSERSVPGAAIASCVCRASCCKRPGAYVLAVEANGQTAFAPLLVDPLSLSLQRCRDGVLTVVNDSEGFTPLKDARITGREILGDARTNAEGVTFAKIFAAGDRAIIAEKDGRFAIGGFGKVFEGVYRTTQEEERERWGDRLERKRIERIHREASLYEDRYIVPPIRIGQPIAARSTRAIQVYRAPVGKTGPG